MSARHWPQLPPVRPSLRPSVRPTSSPPSPPQPGRPGPAQRRPEQPRPREETGAAPARPCPALSSRLSVRPSARASVLVSGRRPSGPCPRCARFVSPQLAVSLSLPSRSRPLPRSGISGPLSQRSSPPLSRPRVLAPPFFGTPPLDLWGPRLQNTLHSPRPPLSLPHILWGVLLDSWGLPPPTPYFPRGSLFSGASRDPSASLSGFLEPQYLPSSLTSEPLCLSTSVRCGCHCLSLLSERPTSLDPAPRLALPASRPCICVSGLTALSPALAASLRACSSAGGRSCSLASPPDPLSPLLSAPCLSLSLFCLCRVSGSLTPIRPSWLCVWSS